jgi:hypothetical protein
MAIKVKGTTKYDKGTVQSLTDTILKDQDTWEDLAENLAKKIVQQSTLDVCNDGAKLKSSAKKAMTPEFLQDFLKEMEDDLEEDSDTNVKSLLEDTVLQEKVMENLISDDRFITHVKKELEDELDIDND